MWRKMTEDDVVDTLTERELSAWRQSTAGKQDVVQGVIDKVAGLVRSYLRAGSVRLSKDSSLLPEGVIFDACMIARYLILSRLPVPMTDDRVKAYQDAIAFLQDVAKRKIIPESYTPEGGEDPSDYEETTTVTPAYSEREPAYRLDGWR